MWPMGGPAIREPERLDREWAFGASAESAVRRSVQRHGVRGRGTALVIGCGALARELVAVAERIPGLDVACLAPDLHNRPDGIPAAVRQRIQRARAEGYEWIFVAYADCGTGGLLDPVLADEGVERLPGAHCYEVFAGGAEFERLADEEPGTFWLTDFLARNFERLVIRGLGIDRHPELQSVYFANYRRVVYLSQTDDPDLLAMAQRAADRLGLAFEHRPTGISQLAAPIDAWARRAETDSRRASGSDAFAAQAASTRPSAASAVPTSPTDTDEAEPVPSARRARIAGEGPRRNAPAPAPAPSRT